MAIFNYKGRTPDGDIVTGEYEAATSTDAANYLLGTGVTPIQIEEIVEEEQQLESIFDSFNKDKTPSLNDLIMFCRQMATLLKAGISILPALQGLKNHIEHPGLAKAIGQISDDLENGRTMSGSMQQFPKIFPALFVSMVNVGENTGMLDRAFLQIYKYLEVDKNTQDQIKSATRYPMFVMIALVMAIVILNIFVIPSFSKVFDSFDSELPLATQILIGSSEFMVNYWPALLIITIMAVVGIRSYIKTTAGKYKWDKLKLRLPLVGTIIERATLARFARSFSPLSVVLSIIAF